MEQIQIATDDYYHEENDDVSTILEDQDSGSDRTESNQNDDQDSESDCKSQTADSTSTDDDQFAFFTRNGMSSRVDGLSDEYESILKSFGVAMGSAAGATEVVAVHKNLDSRLARRARFETFRVFSQAVGKKCGGKPNIRFAWYGGSRDEIVEILVHGFSSVNGDEFGRIQLFPAKYALDAARASEVGDDGLRHVLLCRVIMGKVEELPDVSEQVVPGSNEFDSGVDSVVYPRRYYVWSFCMNSHICPVYVVSFKGPASLEGYVTLKSTRTATKTGRSALGHVTLAALVAALTRFLSPREMKIVVGLLGEFRAKKFDAEELKRKVRLIAGDKLMSAMKLAASSAVKGSGTLGGLQVENGSVRDIYLPDLITVLAEFLPAQKIEMLGKSLGDFKAKKINRPQLASSVRVIVGDDNVLVAAINSYRMSKQRPQDKQSVV